MKRLYLRIYAAMIASLAIFAALAVLGWNLAFERERPGRDERALVAELVAEILPPVDASPEAHRAALERWHARSGVDLALYDAQRRLVASAGEPLPAPGFGEGGREERPVRWWTRVWGGAGGGVPPTWSVRLPDGRWAVARPWRSRARPPVAGGALLLALAVAVAIGAYPLARRVTRRLERLQAGVEALGAGDLGARVPVQGRDEIASLATSFNRAGARIEALLASQRSLLANASHELRSPLARLRMAVALLPSPGRTDARGGPNGGAIAVADVGADRAADGADALRAEIERNVDELDALVEEILLASRLDAGAGIATEPVDLLALLAEECARAQAALRIEPDHDAMVTTDATAGTLDRGGAGGTSGAGRGTGPQPSAGALVVGDPRLLRRLLRNLLENARRHGAGSPIDAVLRASGESIEVDVCDRGPGVPEAERDRIFEPFHRLAGHGEAAGGVGLGLALVRQIAARHGAGVRCLPRAGGGSCFRVSLPAQPSVGGRRVPTTTG